MRIFIVLFALVWVGGFSAALYFAHPDAFTLMTPPEWGEYLSGAFGPPSFIAVVATLIQQGGDLKRQQKQLEEQLRGMERQIDAQTALAETAKSQSDTMLEQARAAARQADAAITQSGLAVERLQIERITNRANGLAMLAVRYADRLVLRPVGAAVALPLIGEKAELRQDFELGPEAVLETVRQRARAFVERAKSQPPASLTVPSKLKQSLESLLNNLIQRVAAVGGALDAAPRLPEVTDMSVDLALRETDRRLRELLELVKGLAVS